MTAFAMPARRGGKDFALIAACQRLWRSVLAEQLRLCSSTNTSELLAAHHARLWLGSAEFHEVCSLAGFDGRWVLRCMRGRVGV